MAYVVYFSEQAKTELAAIKRSGDKKTVKKIADLLIELQEHPRTGTGQVELSLWGQIMSFFISAPSSHSFPLHKKSRPQKSEVVIFVNGDQRIVP